MSKKKTNKILIYVLLILFVAVAANQVIKSKKGERTFKSELTAFSADEVTSISIFTKANNFEEMKMIRDGDDWSLTFGDKEYSADPDMSSNIANDLGKLKAHGVIAKKKDKWAEFDVSDSTGVRVVVQGAKKELCNVLIGRFSYDQSSQKASTFVRLTGEDEVYPVEGYLGMVFNRDINSFRNKSLFRGNQNDLTRISYTYPGDSTFSLSKIENNWVIGDVATDSTLTAKFLTDISYLVGSTFVDTFNPADATYQSFTMTLDGNNMSSVIITGYRNEEGYSVIESSLNPGAYLDATAGGLFDKVFVGEGLFKIQ